MVLSGVQCIIYTRKYLTNQMSNTRLEHTVLPNNTINDHCENKFEN